MRSSKSRSRSKSNRQRSLGNIVNRVFDSSGPEGKVRGTPQQIIDKYLTLARDAQLSNDRVAEQNFLQHAEHYTRMLGEAQRELSREQDMRQGEGGFGGHPQGGHPQGGHPQGGHPQGGHAPQQGGNGNGGGASHGGSQGAGQQPGGDSGHRPQQQQRPRFEDRRDRFEQREDPRSDPPFGDEGDRDDGPGLVDTPEARNSSPVPAAPRPAPAAPQPSAVMMPSFPEPETPAAKPPEAEATPRPARKPRQKRAPEEGETAAEAPKPRRRRAAAAESGDTPEKS